MMNLDRGTFVHWYCHKYTPGDVNPKNYDECANYLQGLIDAFAPHLADDVKARMNRCVDLLRGGANVADQLSRRGVLAPSGSEGAE